MPYQLVPIRNRRNNYTSSSIIHVFHSAQKVISGWLQSYSSSLKCTESQKQNTTIPPPPPPQIVSTFTTMHECSNTYFQKTCAGVKLTPWSISIDPTCNHSTHTLHCNEDTCEKCTQCVWKWPVLPAVHVYKWKSLGSGAIKLMPANDKALA